MRQTAKFKVVLKADDFPKAFVLLSPRSNKETYDAQKLRNATAITNIVNDFGLHFTKDTLVEAIVAANENYGEWHGGTPYLGSKSEVVSLRRSLARAYRLLDEHHVVNRLAAAATQSNLQTPKSNQKLRQYFSSFVSVDQSRATIRGLLDLCEVAEKLDGRTSNSKIRGDLRFAAEPLRQYWVKTAGRSAALTIRGVPSKSVSFLHDCLSLIDTSVTHRVIADF